MDNRNIFEQIVDFIWALILLIPVIAVFSFIYFAVKISYDDYYGVTEYQNKEQVFYKNS